MQNVNAAEQHTDAPVATPSPAPTAAKAPRSLQTLQVISVHHWNDRLFSFRTTRDPGFRFRNGHFVMLGLMSDGKPLLRAYSIASPNHEEYLEFFSIKVPNGKLTSKLQHLQPGDEVLVSGKPVGTLVIDDLNAGDRLFLLATGTGLAPFLSILQDPETYDRFRQVVLIHGVRQISDLAYRDFLSVQLPNHVYLGEMVQEQFRYLPLVTREPFPNQGHIPDLISDPAALARVNIEPLDPRTDRAMICGSAVMLKDTAAALDKLNFRISPSQGVAGDYVIERAFVEK